MRIPLKIFLLWKPDPAKAIALSKKLLAFAEERLGKDTSAASDQAFQLREAVKSAEKRSQELTARLGKVALARSSLVDLK